MSASGGLQCQVTALWTRAVEQETDPDYVPFARTRLKTARIFVDGLGTSYDWPRIQPGPEDLINPNDRAVLMVSAECFEELRHKFAKFDHILTDTSCSRMGENLTVTGICPDSVCVGDVFVNPNSTLKLEVASPRCTCSYTDVRYGKPYARNGIRFFCRKSGLGGWFCRVLQEGDVTEGDTLVRTSCPRPNWSIRRISSLVYHDANAANKIRTWGGTRIELLQLATGVPELAWYLQYPNTSCILT